MSDTLDAALSYLERGWSVLPVGACKRPLIPWREYQTRRPSPEQVRTWYAAYPEAGVGMVTGAVSGVFVLDLDAPDWRALGERCRGVLPRTPIARTGRGWHLFFRHPGAPVPNRVGVLPGVDVRGDGGFVVLAPSLHPSGRRYEWRVSPDEAAVSEAPGWVWEVLDAPPPAPPADQGGVFEPGTRNASLFRVARSLRASGLSSEAIGAAVYAENAARCRPPLAALEVAGIVRNALRLPDSPEYAEAYR
ncbi:MAG: bifunctional DNA primase/polymerase [Gemmatimonadetes bacterium]|nr:bifunctional DNA primase/polymerase [Gemmatimonadota bacterium]